ncbi:MAG: hypothetical protein COA86_12705 [Kangiella sp.]|nr:MAG: hypothetical protein COA86_12705 [Kangiella sp.]
MLLQKEIADGAVHIKAYSEGKIRLNIGEYTDLVILKEYKFVEINSIISFEELSTSLLDELTDNSPEILIIGTGFTHQIMDISLIKYLNDKGIAIEAMASRQACHTYEVLSHDRRKVNALIFA